MGGGKGRVEIIFICPTDQDPSLKGQLKPVFISVDPDRDTPEKIAVYIKRKVVCLDLGPHVPHTPQSSTRKWWG